MKEVFSSVLSKSWLLLIVLRVILFCTRLSLNNLFKAMYYRLLFMTYTWVVKTNNSHE